MSTTTICDQCGAVLGAHGLHLHVAKPFVTWGEEPETEVDLCGYECLAVWAARHTREAV